MEQQKLTLVECLAPSWHELTLSKFYSRLRFTDFYWSCCDVSKLAEAASLVETFLVDRRPKASRIFAPRERMVLLLEPDWWRWLPSGQIVLSSVQVRLKSLSRFMVG